MSDFNNIVENLHAENDYLKQVLETISHEIGDKNNGTCPICSTYSHKNWCWYPLLVQAIGGKLDSNDMIHLKLFMETSEYR